MADFNWDDEINQEIARVAEISHGPLGALSVTPLTPAPAPAQLVATRPDELVKPAQSPESRNGADIDALFGEGGASSSAIVDNVPQGYSPAALSCMFAVSSGVAENAAHMIFRAMEGLKTRDARGLLATLGNALQHLDSGEVVNGIPPLAEIKKVANASSPTAFLNAIRARTVRRALFVPPSRINTYFIQHCAPKMARLVPDFQARTLTCVFGDGKRTELVPMSRLTDQKVGALVREMRELVDGAFETCSLKVEHLVRLGVYLHPISIVGSKLVEMDMNRHGQYLRVVDPMWVDKMDSMGKLVYRLKPVAAALAKLVFLRARRYEVPQGSNTQDPFSVVLHAFVSQGLDGLDKVERAVDGFLTAAKYEIKIDAYVDPIAWQDAAPATKIALMREKANNMVALKFLSQHRSARHVPILEKLCASVDQNGFAGDLSLGQQDKIARVVAAFPLKANWFHENSKHLVAVGIDKGYTAPFLAGLGFRLYDLKAKEVAGVVVQRCDVVNTEQTTALLRDAKFALFDVATSTTGQPAGDKLERCSYRVNETVFQHMVNAVCASKTVEYAAIKGYLPDTDITVGMLPESVRLLQTHFDVRVLKAGKLHNDELFYLCQRRAKPLDPLDTTNVKSILFGYAYVSLAIINGNQLIARCLATGSCGPQYEIREEGGVRRLYVKWVAQEWRPALRGEAAVYMYTHSLHPSLMHERESLPLFGRNAGVHVDVDTGASVVLHEMFKAEIGEAQARAAVLNVASVDEAPPMEF